MERLTERLKMTGRGNDSTVYLPEHGQYVIKIYDCALGMMDLETRRAFLNMYVADTMRASEIIDRYNKDNAARSFNSRLGRYDIKLSVPAQGEIREIFPLNFDEIPRLGHREYIATIGQRYIEGDNAAKIFEDYNHNTGVGIFHEAINSFESGLKSSLEDLHEILRRHIGRDFIVGYANVKPVLDTDRCILRFEITDLADSLLAAYTGHV